YSCATSRSLFCFSPYTSPTEISTLSLHDALPILNGSPLSVAEKEALPNSVRVWVKLVGIGMIGVALAALYRDDEEYEEFNDYMRSEEHTSELQSREKLVCRLLLEKKK